MTSLWPDLTAGPGVAAAVEEVTELLDLAFDDGTAGWELGSDGEWTQLAGPDGARLRNLQEHLISIHKHRRRGQHDRASGASRG